MSHMKFVPASDTIFLGSPNPANTILTTLIRLSPEIYNREFAVVMYNAL